MIHDIPVVPIHTGSGSFYTQQDIVQDAIFDLKYQHQCISPIPSQSGPVEFSSDKFLVQVGVCVLLYLKELIMKNGQWRYDM